MHTKRKRMLKSMGPLVSFREKTVSCHGELLSCPSDWQAFTVLPGPRPARRQHATVCTASPCAVLVCKLILPRWAHSVYLSELHLVLTCNMVESLSGTSVEKILWPLCWQRAAIFLQEWTGSLGLPPWGLAESFTFSRSLWAQASSCLRG